ncbi:MAG TPA: carboxypeptidase regulatory-like domain-containing protein [Polyangiaceae bacterium]|nr:carboxypeptidase regulatory-like domain-containing protein [Polyangiaceae bacterium]
MKNPLNAIGLRRVSVVSSLAAMAALATSCSTKAPDSEIGPSNPANPTAATGGAASNVGGSGVNTGSTLNLGGDIAKSMPDGPCKGLECQVQTCEGAARTTITGKVYDPAGKLPLYNVAVYVPNGPVGPLTEGASCDRCGASILNPVTSAITDESGTFVLADAPVGANIPLVIQVGKWRRQITIPAVNGCVDNPLTDPQLTRLPRNKAEGDLPRIAISTGGGDQMECLPWRMGVDPAEFTTADGDGRIHLFSGDAGQYPPLANFDASHNAGAALTPSSTGLWASTDTLKKYDIVILSCEAGTNERDKTPAMRQAMYDYASLGGRVFASHLHSVWFADGPDPVPTTGTWRRVQQNPPDPSTATVNTTFPKGAALAQWLVNVQASTTLGQVSVSFPRNDVQAVTPSVASEWLTVPDPLAVQYLSFNTPIGATEDKVCGREVFSSLHVASVDIETLPALNAKGFPASCEQRDLSAQEKVVAFMLFDLSACVQNEKDPIKPPK